MDNVKVRFVEERVVDDVHVGTVRETRFRAGQVYELDARSADRWVKRGAARFLSDEDAAKGSGASSDAALDMLDPKRKDADAHGGNPGQVSATSDSPTGADAERIGLSERIAGMLVAARNDLSPTEWAALPAEEQVALLQAAAAEIEEHSPGLVPGRELTTHAATPFSELAPGTVDPRIGPVGGALPDTDGDRMGDSASSTNPLGSTPAGADFDAMSDEALRDFIEERDGKRPRANASRETLLAKAKGDQA